MFRVCDVPGDGDKCAGGGNQRVDGIGQAPTVASVDDDVPATADELGCQRAAEAA